MIRFPNLNKINIPIPSFVIPYIFRLITHTARKVIFWLIAKVGFNRLSILFLQFVLTDLSYQQGN